MEFTPCNRLAEIERETTRQAIFAVVVSMALATVAALPFLPL